MNEIGLRKTDLDTPALWVDLQRMERNINVLASHFKQTGLAWRPHTKGIKVPAIAHKAIAAGAIGITCAKLGEAEVMVSAGIQDILIANQVAGAHKITRLAQLQRHAKVMVAIDNPDNVAQLGKIATAHGVEIPVLVEVDTGMDRAGVAPGQATVELSLLAHRTTGLRYRGVMAWEGHTVAIQNPAEKYREVRQAIDLISNTAQACRDAGLSVEIVSGGGSGTYRITPQFVALTEMQTGGAIFNDVTYESWGVQTEPAIYVQAMITSRPKPDRIICDAGFKTLSNGYNPEPLGVDGITSMSCSAEHGTIALDRRNYSHHVGDVLDIKVGYTDATLFLHDTLYGIRNGVVETAWPILGRGKLR